MSTIAYASAAGFTERLSPERSTSRKRRARSRMWGGVLVVFRHSFLRSSGIGTHGTRQTAAAERSTPKGRSLGWGAGEPKGGDGQPSLLI